MTRKSISKAPQQLLLLRRGGFRRGAGRKPKGDRPLVSHEKRERITRHKPLLVTTRLLPDLPNLRREDTCAALREALSAGSDRFGFRLVEFSMQRDHLHLIAEADDARSLSRGMAGLLVRVAKTLNKHWRRAGKVFRDRYHATVLKCPRHVRYALVYVLQNARKHREIAAGIDPLSSGPSFRGWKDRIASLPRVVAEAGSWLLTSGWQRTGLISTHERPALKPPWA